MADIHQIELEHNTAGKLTDTIQRLFEERMKNSLSKGQEEQPSDRVYITDDAMTNTLLVVASKSNFDETIEWTWFYIWHHEGRRARHGASMMAPDYAHWHGTYEVADRWYNEFLPEAMEIIETAKKKRATRAGANAAEKVLEEILASWRLNPVSAEDRVITVSTTTSTEASGLLDVLLPALEKDTGIKVKVVAKGTGAAIRDGRDGNVDVIFVHARQRELAFVKEGFGTRRHAVIAPPVPSAILPAPMEESPEIATDEVAEPADLTFTVVGPELPIGGPTFRGTDSETPAAPRRETSSTVDGSRKEIFSSCRSPPMYSCTWCVPPT